jgi:hypothetical protein
MEAEDLLCRFDTFGTLSGSVMWCLPGERRSDHVRSEIAEQVGFGSIPLQCRSICDCHVAVEQRYNDMNTLIGQ